MFQQSRQAVLAAQHRLKDKRKSFYFRKKKLNFWITLGKSNNKSVWHAHTHSSVQGSKTLFICSIHVCFFLQENINAVGVTSQCSKCESRPELWTEYFVLGVKHNNVLIRLTTLSWQSELALIWSTFIVLTALCLNITQFNIPVILLYFYLHESRNTHLKNNHLCSSFSPLNYH